MGPRSKMVQMWGGYTSRPYGGYREGRGIKLRDSDMDRIARDGRRHVDEVSSVIYGEAQTISYADKSINGEYTGMYPSARLTENHELIAGRYINDRDMAELAHVMVLSEDFARQLFPPDGMAAVGKRVNCRGLSWLVVGVYRANWYRDNIVPYTTARHISKNPEEVGSLKVTLKNVNMAKPLRATYASHWQKHIILTRTTRAHYGSTTVFSMASRRRTACRYLVSRCGCWGSCRC